MKSRIFLNLILVLVSFFPHVAQAANHYVREGASGNGSGVDWSNAYTILPTTLVRGDTYYVADGSYPGRNFSTTTNGTTLITIKKATMLDHGSNVGWDTTYGDGHAQFTSGLEFSSSYWLIDGQSGGGAENKWQGNFGIKVTETNDGNAIIRIAYSGTADNITVRHVEMQGKGSASTNGGSASNDAVAIYGASNVTISYFRMHGVGRCPFFVSPKNLVVEHGWVESFNGSSAVHSEVASIWAFDGSVGDVTFRYNLITDIQSTGGIMWDNSSNTGAKLSVYGNVFYKPPGANWGTANGVVGGWTGGGGEQFHNVGVYNNTFVNVDQESLSTFPNIASGNRAYNNLFYNCDSPSFAKFSAHDNNHFINSGGNHSEPMGTNAASGDPFVNMASLDFRLKVATSAGATLSSPFNVDAFNNTRGGDGVWDRGAFEFGGSATSGKTIKSTPTKIQVIN